MQIINLDGCVELKQNGYKSEPANLKEKNGNLSD